MKRIAVILVAIFIYATTAFSQDEKYKALFIYNFTKHIEWPESMKSGDFVIGVVNEKNIYNNLLNIAQGKKAGNQNIVIKQFDSPEDIGNCHILFVSTSSSNNKNLEAVLQNTSKTNTLLVTERNGLAKKGACINFVIQNSKIKFELNKNTLMAQNLKVSSYLENLAIAL